ncbi:MAG: thiosulfohydrolase SoxB, partial [Candidatus Puniceispirillaceae bacterium]|nr:thiosulfohydrolase SoxB [Pseudomonadota bacterium]
MRSRREFLQFAAASAGVFSAYPSFAAAAARQQLSQDDLLSFDAKGQVTLLHLTDIHGQLKPVYFRPPSENFGVANFEGIPPHLVGQDFLRHFGIAPGSALAYAHTMVDYESLARAYGRLGGLDRTATLVKAIRAERGDDSVLLLDGGDTWQGSYTSL